MGNEIIMQKFSPELFGRWLAYIDAKPKTVETYTKSIQQFSGYISENGISQPTRADIIAYREKLKENHKPATVQAYIIAVRLFFRWTQQEASNS